MTLSHYQEDGDSKKVLILFHSGSGSTRTISEIFRDKLSESYTVDMIQVGRSVDYRMIYDYDFVLFGFPTYHCRPSKSMLEFVDNMPVGGLRKTAFVFTTCGLYMANSLRILIKKLQERSVITAGFLQIKGPASDGALLYPASFHRMYKYEKKTRKKIEQAVSDMDDLIHSRSPRPRTPAYRWYVPINDVVGSFGEKVYDGYRDSLHVLGEKCTNCNLCVQNCERGCWVEGEEQPSFDPVNCEFCLECVHNCPQKAVIFSEKMKDRPRLNKAYYQKLKAGLLGTQS